MAAERERSPVVAQQPEVDQDHEDPRAFWDFMPRRPGETAMDVELQRKSSRYVPAGFLQYGAELQPHVELERISLEEARDLFYGRFVPSPSWMARHLTNEFVDSVHGPLITELYESSAIEDVEIARSTASIVEKYSGHIDNLLRSLRPLLEFEAEQSLARRDALVFERGVLPPRVLPVSTYSYDAYVAIGRWYFVLVIPFDASPIVADLFHQCRQLAKERDGVLAMLLANRK